MHEFKYSNSQIKAAAENAQILSHIENNLPEKFKSNIGEDGVKFSGGTETKNWYRKNNITESRFVNLR